MADVSNHYVNCEQLQKTITRINDIKVTNMSIESKLLEELDELKGTVKINSKSIDNKRDEIQKSIELFKKNSEGCTQSFNAVINRYEGSVRNAVSYINSQNVGGMNNG